MNLKRALAEYNRLNPHAKMKQKDFGMRYFGGSWKPEYKSAVSKMINGKAKVVDVAKCAKILGTSTDYLHGLTDEFTPCY